jgi:ribosome biogenesis protein BMS1
LPKKDEWQGMKTVYELRKERQLKIPQNPDSAYHPIVRKPRKFNPLHIPKSLQARLPFKTVPKLEKPRKKPTLASRRARVLEPEEKKRMELLVELGTFKNEKLRAKKEKMKQKLAEYQKMKAKEEAERERKQKMNRKRLYRLEGLLSKHKRPPKKQKVK